MKLLVCLTCSDVFNLTYDLRTCSCGKSSGKYLSDGLNAVVSGDCMPIGFANDSFVEALTKQRIENKHYDGNKETCCKGIEFKAFTIPPWANTIEIVTKVKKEAVIPEKEGCHSI